MERFQRTVWSAKEGAPGGNIDLAQTSDGYLWLGTKTGLYHFDGVRFEQYPTGQQEPLQSDYIYRLFGASDGGLWIGYFAGGASFLKDGKITDYRVGEGLPTSPVVGFAEDKPGSIWALLVDGSILHLEGSHWNAIVKDWTPLEDVEQIFGDGTGTLWIRTLDGLYFMPFGERRFRPLQKRGPGVLLLTPFDAFILQRDAIDVNAKALHANNQTPIAGPLDRIVQASRDRQGGFWFCSAASGVSYSTSPVGRAAVQKTGPANGQSDRPHLTDRATMPCAGSLVDREGNFWESTKSTLERYRPTSVVPVTFPANYTDFALGRRDTDGIWVAAEKRTGGMLAEIRGSKIISQTSIPRPASIYRDALGALWIGTRTVGKILRILGNSRTAVDTHSHAAAGAATIDRQGRLWVLMSGKGYFRLDRGNWTSLASMGAPPHGSLTSFSDSNGRVWFGFQQNRVVVLDGDKTSLLSQDNGVQVGNVTTIQGRNGSVWIGGEKGLGRFDGHRFVSMLPHDRASFANITGIIPTDGDGIWFGESSGIIHVPAPELGKFEKDPSHHVLYRTFGTLDGLTAPLQPSFPSPAAIQGADGLLWFATSDGVVWIDPKEIPRNTQPPPVAISSLTSNSRMLTVAPSSSFSLPARTTSLQIAYTALSLTIPERVRFRYKLEGQENTWQDAGQRREAIYTNLGPGTYRFRVIACNNDGVWNETGAAFDFNIAPAYYQTWWFRLLCVVLSLGLLRSFYVYRLRLATARVQRRLGAQMEERERIARELHDTLLQGFQGLMLRLQAIMKTLPKDQPAHQMMEQVLDRADGVLLEGRQSVRDLRAKGSSGTELAQALSNCGEELALGHSTLFSLTVVGVPQPVAPIVFDEAYRIAREALINAFQHSKATKIETEVAYNASGISLKIRDDGTGVKADILTLGREGHWGFSGMRERAHTIGAQMAIWSRPGAGTEIELTIPAKVAYLSTNPLTLWQQTKRMVGRAEETRP